MALQFRLLGPEDADLLSRGTSDVFDYAVKPELAAKYLKQDGYVIAVALDDGEIVGMASGFTYFHPDKPLEFYVNECGTHDAYLRRGIAKKLMQLLFGWARERGCTYAWLGTETDNDAANALYLSLGGKAQQMNFYEFDLTDKSR